MVITFHDLPLEETMSEEEAEKLEMEFLEQVSTELSSDEMEKLLYEQFVDQMTDRLTISKNFHYRVKQSSNIESDYEIIIDALSDVLGQTPEFKMLTYIVSYVYKHRMEESHEENLK